MTRLLVFCASVLLSASSLCGATLYSTMAGTAPGNLHSGIYSNTGGSYQAAAVSFTPNQSAALTHIELRMLATFDTEILVKVLQDSLGGPGLQIEAITLPISSSPSTQVVTVYSTVNPILTVGTTYWLALLPLQLDEPIGWENRIGPANYASIDGVNWTGPNNDETTAFAIYGSPVPEPSTFALAAGCLSLLALRKKLRLTR